MVKAKKAPARRRRATPVSFKKDEKVDSIVEEIKKGLVEDTEPAGDLEKEIAETIEKKKEESEKKEADLTVEAPFGSEDDASSENEKETEKESSKPEEKEEERSEENAEDTEKEKLEEEKDPEPEEKESAFAPTREENPFPPLEEEKKRSFKWPIIYIILFIAGMVTGFVIFDQLSSRSEFSFPSFSTPSPTPTVAPSPTPTPEQVDLTQYKVNLENGSGTGGEAGRLQSALEDDGFTIEDIGNADKSTYEATVIKAKNGTNAQFLSELRKSLEKTYVVEKDIETLDEDETVDAIVVIGSEKKDTE